MEFKSQQPKEPEGVISVLNGFVEAFNLAKEISSNTPAKAVFGSVSVLLAMIRVSLLAICRSNIVSVECAQDTMANKVDYVELGLACADVCTTLKRGLDEKSEDDLSDSVRKAIKQLRRWVTPKAQLEHLVDDAFCLTPGRWRRSKRGSSSWENEM